MVGPLFSEPRNDLALAHKSVVSAGGNEVEISKCLLNNRVAGP